MGLFRRKAAAASHTSALGDQPPRDRQSLIDAIREEHPLPIAPRAGLFGLAGQVISKLFGVIQDPNGKISSKRAGAGALITAGIAFLMETPPQTQPAIVCMGFATLLFILTKYDTTAP